MHLKKNVEGKLIHKTMQAKFVWDSKLVKIDLKKKNDKGREEKREEKEKNEREKTWRNLSWIKMFN